MLYGVYPNDSTTLFKIVYQFAIVVCVCAWYCWRCECWVWVRVCLCVCDLINSMFCHVNVLFQTRLMCSNYWTLDPYSIVCIHTYLLSLITQIICACFLGQLFCCGVVCRVAGVVVDGLLLLLLLLLLLCLWHGNLIANKWCWEWWRFSIMTINADEWMIYLYLSTSTHTHAHIMWEQNTLWAENTINL